MIKFLLFILSSAVFAYFPSNIWHKDFIPSEQCCGAARNVHDDLSGNDNVNCRIKCMIAGYKKVYWGTKKDFSYIAKEFLPIENLGIHSIEVKNGLNFNNKPEEASLILYTSEGKEQALMLEEYEHIFARKYARNPQKDLNHYLIGILLNYSNEDISYFYTVNKISGFEKDKEKAQRFLKKHNTSESN